MRCVKERARRLLVPLSNPFQVLEIGGNIQQDGEWYITYYREVPGANGQGRSKDEARENLAEAIGLILEDRREEALRGVPEEAMRETVVVE